MDSLDAGQPDGLDGDVVADAGSEPDAGSETDAVPTPADLGIESDGAALEDGGPEMDPTDAAIASDDAALDGADGSRPDQGALPGDNDVGDEPCFPAPTQLACNDNSGSLQSAISFPWDGGDVFLFVDGFGRSFGTYQLNVSVVYPLGGQCGPELHAYAGCAMGTHCLPNEAAGFPTCQ